MQLFIYLSLVPPVSLWSPAVVPVGVALHRGERGRELCCGRRCCGLVLLLGHLGGNSNRKNFESKQNDKVLIGRSSRHSWHELERTWGPDWFCMAVAYLFIMSSRLQDIMPMSNVVYRYTPFIICLEVEVSCVLVWDHAHWLDQKQTHTKPLPSSGW